MLFEYLLFNVIFLIFNITSFGQEIYDMEAFYATIFILNLAVKIFAKFVCWKNVFYIIKVKALKCGE